MREKYKKRGITRNERAKGEEQEEGIWQKRSRRIRLGRTAVIKRAEW